MGWGHSNLMTTRAVSPFGDRKDRIGLRMLCPHMFDLAQRTSGKPPQQGAYLY